MHIKSRFILNGVCTRWRGWIDLDRLDGVGCVEFDEEAARVSFHACFFLSCFYVTFPCTRAIRHHFRSEQTERDAMRQCPLVEPAAARRGRTVSRNFELPLDGGGSRGPVIFNMHASERVIEWPLMIERRFAVAHRETGTVEKHT